MSQIHATASAVIDAAPEPVYAVLADYYDGHPHILPGRYFSGLKVVEGGIGAGTLIRFNMRALGVTRQVLALIREPEPGRILAERDFNTGAQTTFTVDPCGDRRRTTVTISTTWKANGLEGLIQRWLAPPLLRRIYREELENLARFVDAKEVAYERARLFTSSGQNEMDRVNP